VVMHINRALVGSCSGHNSSLRRRRRAESSHSLIPRFVIEFACHGRACRAFLIVMLLVMVQGRDKNIPSPSVSNLAWFAKDDGSLTVSGGPRAGMMCSSLR